MSTERLKTPWGESEPAELDISDMRRKLAEAKAILRRDSRSPKPCAISAEAVIAGLEAGVAPSRSFRIPNAPWLAKEEAA